jgi:hypothetical protein
MNILPRAHAYYVADLDPNLERVTDSHVIAAIIEAATEYPPEWAIERFPCLLVGDHAIYGVTSSDPHGSDKVYDLLRKEGL